MVPNTRQRILDAAEKLFARHGFESTSLRSIIASAGVNLAAIHYHFRSKEGLIGAVIERRFAPVNDERLRLLAEYESQADGRVPLVEEILEAFLAPMLRVGLLDSGQGQSGRVAHGSHHDQGLAGNRRPPRLEGLPSGE